MSKLEMPELPHLTLPRSALSYLDEASAALTRASAATAGDLTPLQRAILATKVELEKARREAAAESLSTQRSSMEVAT